MPQFSLKQKIFSGYIVLVIFMILLGGIAFASTQRLQQIHLTLEEQTRGIADLHSLEAHLKSLETLLGARTGIFDQVFLAGAQKHYAAAKDEFAKYVKIDRRSLTLDDRDLIDRTIEDVRKELVEINTLLLQMEPLVSSGQLTASSPILQSISTLIEDVTESDIDELIEVQEKVVAGAQDNQANVFRYITIFIFITVPVGILAGILIAWFVTARVGNILNQFISRLTEATKELLRSSESSANVSHHNTALASEIAKGAEHQAKESSEISKVISQMASAVHQTSSATQEVSQVATRTSQMAQIGGEAGEKSTKSLVKIREIVSSSSGMVKNLSSRSQEIAGIIEVITNIAEQTNLLALNAAIEAARAGDAGRGFAVVADEVRKLAEEAQKSGTQIKEVVKNMQAQIGDIVRSVDDGTKEVDVSVGVIDETLNTLQSITSAVQQVSSKIQEISASTQQQASSSEQMSKTMDSIVSVIDKNSFTANEMKHAAEDQAKFAQHVQAWSQKLRELSDELLYLAGGHTDHLVEHGMHEGGEYHQG